MARLQIPDSGIARPGLIRILNFNSVFYIHARILPRVVGQKLSNQIFLLNFFFPPEIKPNTLYRNILRRSYPPFPSSFPSAASLRIAFPGTRSIHRPFIESNQSYRF